VLVCHEQKKQECSHLVSKEKKIMPILMVAQSAIKNLNNICERSDLSDQPLDFTMSKFKPTSPMRHPFYQQFFGSASDIAAERNECEEQGKLIGHRHYIASRILSADTLLGQLRATTFGCLQKNILLNLIIFC
jgi:hypothetical protein